MESGEEKNETRAGVIAWEHEEGEVFNLFFSSPPIAYIMLRGTHIPRDLCTVHARFRGISFVPQPAYV